MFSGVNHTFGFYFLFIYFPDQWYFYGMPWVSRNEIPIYVTALVRNKDLNYDGSIRDPVPGTNQIAGAVSARTSYALLQMIAC
jgi:hypothetical protein